MFHLQSPSLDIPGSWCNPGDMGSVWSQQEVWAAVEDYFTMLAQEMRGLDYNKTRHRNGLLPKLEGRSHGSVEKKHQNISAVLLELGLPYIDGYKPLPNYQRMLGSEVASFIQAHPDLLAHLSSLATAINPELVPVSDLDNLVVSPPDPLSSARPKKPLVIPPVVRKYNFAEQEARNRNLGRKGEEFVMEFEGARLVKAGRKDLAKRIEWVSEEKGDGAGFDIASFDEGGGERLIEVKTTNYGRSFPFLLTRNELSFSESNKAFCLYRVFQFHRGPRLFMLPGSVSTHCRLEPKTYVASFSRVA